MNLCIYGSLKLEQACTNLREYLDMMLLQIEQACTNLQEYLYSLNIGKIYIRAVTEIVLPHFCYSPFVCVF